MSSSDKDSSKSYLPKDWNDDLRMSALFAPIRGQVTNPEDLKKKVAFWSSAVKSWSSSYNRAVFTFSDVEKAFQRKGKTPACLTTVLSEMERQGELSNSSKLNNKFLDNGWYSWTLYYFIYSPLEWTIKQSKQVFGYNTDITNEYVNIEVLKKHATELLRLHEKNVQHKFRDSIISVSELNDVWKHKDADCSTTEMKLMLLFLQKEGRVSMLNISGQEVVKIARKDENKVTVNKEVDSGVFIAKQSVTSLNNELDILQSKWDEETKEIKLCLKDKNKRRAQHHLRERKSIERRQEKALAMLENVNKLLDSMEENHSNMKVIDAFKIGVDALKQSTPKFEDVSDIMTQVEDTLTDQSELQDIMSKPIQFEATLASDAELEDELEDLLRQGTNTNESSHVGADKVPDITILPELNISSQSGVSIGEKYSKLSSRLANL